jgi:hypothetical protein
VRISSTKFNQTSKSKPKSNKEELKELTRERAERARESQDNKRPLKVLQPPQLLSNQLPKPPPLLNKNPLKRREKVEEEDPEKVNNDHLYMN